MMRVMGYWPLEGSAGVSFLKKLQRSASASLEKHLREALRTYENIAQERRAGGGLVEIKPESFEVMARSKGGVEKAKAVYGIQEDNGRLWMPKRTYDEAARAFVACVVLYRALGGVPRGDMYGGQEEGIAQCAAKLSGAQIDSLKSLANSVQGALSELDEITRYHSSDDRTRMSEELQRFGAAFG